MFRRIFSVRISHKAFGLPFYKVPHFLMATQKQPSNQNASKTLKVEANQKKVKSQLNQNQKTKEDHSKNQHQNQQEHNQSKNDRGELFNLWNWLKNLWKYHKVKVGFFLPFIGYIFQSDYLQQYLKSSYYSPLYYYWQKRLYAKQQLQISSYYVEDTSVERQLYQILNQHQPNSNFGLSFVVGFSGKSSAIKKLIKQKRQKKTPFGKQTEQLTFYINMSEQLSKTPKASVLQLQQDLSSQKTQFQKSFKLVRLISVLHKRKQKQLKDITLVIDDIDEIRNGHELCQILHGITALHLKGIKRVICLSNSSQFTQICKQLCPKFAQKVLQWKLQRLQKSQFDKIIDKNVDYLSKTEQQPKFQSTADKPPRSYLPEQVKNYFKNNYDTVGSVIGQLSQIFKEMYHLKQYMQRNRNQKDVMGILQRQQKNIQLDKNKQKKFSNYLINILKQQQRIHTNRSRKIINDTFKQFKLTEKGNAKQDLLIKINLIDQFLKMDPKILMDAAQIIQQKNQFINMDSKNYYNLIRRLSNKNILSFCQPRCQYDKWAFQLYKKQLKQQFNRLK